MLTIECPICHDEILVMPDLKVMSKAIDVHVKKHKRRGVKGVEHVRNILLCSKIRTNLTHQTLKKVFG